MTDNDGAVAPPASWSPVDFPGLPRQGLICLEHVPLYHRIHQALKDSIKWQARIKSTKDVTQGSRPSSIETELLHREYESIVEAFHDCIGALAQLDLSDANMYLLDQLYTSTTALEQPFEHLIDLTNSAAVNQQFPVAPGPGASSTAGVSPSEGAVQAGISAELERLDVSNDNVEPSKEQWEVFEMVDNATTPAAGPSTEELSDPDILELRKAIQLSIDASATLKARVQLFSNTESDPKTACGDIRSIVPECGSLHRAVTLWTEVIPKAPVDLNTTASLTQMVATLQQNLEDVLAQCEQAMDAACSKSCTCPFPTAEVPVTKVSQLIEDKSAMETVSNASIFSNRGGESPVLDDNLPSAAATDQLSMEDFAKDKRKADGVDEPEGPSIDTSMDASGIKADAEGNAEKAKWPWPYRLMNIDPATPEAVIQETLDE